MAPGTHRGPERRRGRRVHVDAELLPPGNALPAGAAAVVIWGDAGHGGSGHPKPGETTNPTPKTWRVPKSHPRTQGTTNPTPKPMGTPDPTPKLRETPNPTLKPDSTPEYMETPDSSPQPMGILKFHPIPCGDPKICLKGNRRGDLGSGVILGGSWWVSRPPKLGDPQSQPPTI